MADEIKAEAKDAVPGSAVQKWLDIIKSYDTEFSDWEKRVEKILKRYRDEKRQENTDNPTTRFNILWANVSTLVPATFARLPQPDVSRRFSDRDPVGRVAAMLLERALEFEVQHYPDYRSTMRQSVQDRFLGGRGTSWARYEPHIKAGATQQPIDGDQVTEDVDTPNEELDYECAPVDYVHWKDFGHTVARTWEEVTAVWRVVYMTRDACLARFGDDIGKRIPLDAMPDDLKRDKMANPELKEQERARVYEIWDKENEKAIWINKSMREVLDEKDDPLQLEGFFPCPRPLYATTTNESLVPIPDFTLYQDQANELDVCSDRIDGLVKALQVKGCYDASLGTEVGRLFTDASNTSLIPVKNWQAFAEKNGLKGAIDIVDLAPIAKGLEQAYLAMEQIKRQVYEITGISDIVRGETTGAAKTATEQKIKGQYASLRLRSMQQEVAIYATELLRLKAQIISNFDPQTLMAISAADQLAEADQQYVMPALQMIKNKPLRSFRIEIAADSLVQIDEETEKQDRVEFLTAVGTYIGKAAEVGAAAPTLVPLLMELLKFGVTGFKVGKTVEGTIDKALEDLKQKAAQAAMQPPPPDPKVEAEKIKMQGVQVKAQAEAQKAQMSVAVEAQKAQIDKERMAMEQQHDVRQMQIDGAAQQQDMAMQQQAGNMKAQQMQAQHRQKMEQAAMKPPARKQ